MKTLEEVIKAIEEMTANPTEGDYENEGYYLAKDSLFYLKEYRDNRENKKIYDRGYKEGYKKAKHEDEISKRWDDSYRASQMPWNHGCEMGG